MTVATGFRTSRTVKLDVRIHLEVSSVSWYTVLFSGYQIPQAEGPSEIIKDDAYIVYELLILELVLWLKEIIHETQKKMTQK